MKFSEQKKKERICVENILPTQKTNGNHKIWNIKYITVRKVFSRCEGSEVFKNEDNMRERKDYERYTL